MPSVKHTLCGGQNRYNWTGVKRNMGLVCDRMRGSPWNKWHHGMATQQQCTRGLSAQTAQPGNADAGVLHHTLYSPESKIASLHLPISLSTSPAVRPSAELPFAVVLPAANGSQTSPPSPSSAATAVGPAAVMLSCRPAATKEACMLTVCVMLQASCCSGILPAPWQPSLPAPGAVLA